MSLSMDVTAVSLVLSSVSGTQYKVSLVSRGIGIIMSEPRTCEDHIKIIVFPEVSLNPRPLNP